MEGIVRMGLIHESIFTMVRSNTNVSHLSPDVNFCTMRQQKCLRNDAEADMRNPQITIPRHTNFRYYMKLIQTTESLTLCSCGILYGLVDQVLVLHLARL